MTANSFRPEDHPRFGDGQFRPTLHADPGLVLQADQPQHRPRITADDIYTAGDSWQQYRVATEFLRQNSSDPEAAEWLETIDDREHDHSEYEGAGVTTGFREEVINRVVGMANDADKAAAAEARREIGRLSAKDRRYLIFVDDPRNLPPLQLPEDAYSPKHSGLDDVVAKHGATFNDEEWDDYKVAAVTDGPLSRGIANKQRRQALSTWHDWAQEQEAETGEKEFGDFARGLESGIETLYRSHITESFGDAVDLAGKKRANAEDREHWRLMLQHQANDETRRGHMAAGLILSGADSYWDMRDRPGVTVKGR